MNSMLTVIRFTLLNRLKTKSFKITTLIFVLLISAVVNLPAIIQQFSKEDGKEAVKIGVMANGTDIQQKLTDYFAAAKTGTGTIEIVPLESKGGAEADAALIREKLKNKDVKGVLTAKPAGAGEFPQLLYQTGASGFSMNPGTDETAGLLKTALQTIKTNSAIAQAGIEPAVLAKIQEPVKLTTETVALKEAETPAKSKEELGIAFILVYALLFLLYMSVIGYGSMVSTEITAEKSSRVMEILISSGSPLKQMFGKIIGICLMGLLQNVVFGIVVAVNLTLPWNGAALQSMDLDLSLIPYGLLGYFLLFYLGGFFIYATIFAAIGSLVSRSEEVQQAVMPVTLLIIIAFMTAMFGLQNPEAPFVIAMSYVPFFSPLIMFLRIGLGSPAWWEITISIAIMLGSIFVLGWLSAKIYRTGVLMYGKRPSWKELRKAMKAFQA
ncbi:ABC transporter permease [Paenibacillus sp. RC84]|uniref:ABC transporter permease n=1 Tax=Paenibacillus sp. RC84 TaxID=3156252 RepID=UPI003510F6AB